MLIAYTLADAIVDDPFIGLCLLAAALIGIWLLREVFGPKRRFDITVEAEEATQATPHILPFRGTPGPTSFDDDCHSTFTSVHRKDIA